MMEAKDLFNGHRCMGAKDPCEMSFLMSSHSVYACKCFIEEYCLLIITYLQKIKLFLFKMNKRNLICGIN